MKTLIVLDTNKVRSMQSGGASYSSFEFSSEFNDLETYVKDNGLSEFIEIAIPRVAIEELLQQKAEQYTKDIRGITGIKDRLSELPGVNFAGVSLPPTGFDCKEHLKPRMADFIQHKELTVMDIGEEKFGQVLKEVLRRAVERQPPFRLGKNSTDIGFKDVMIWESILNYESYDRFEKVILFTMDSGFNEKCKEEFEKKVKKKLVIIPSMELLQSEIEEDYSSQIETKEWRDFVGTDYFKSYFMDQLSKLEYVTVNDVERKVIQIEVVNYLDKVEEPGEDDQPDSAIVLIASMKGMVEIDGGSKEVNIKARTVLDDAKGIQYTEFGAEEQ